MIISFIEQGNRDVTLATAKAACCPGRGDPISIWDRESQSITNYQVVSVEWTIGRYERTQHPKLTAWVVVVKRPRARKMTEEERRRGEMAYRFIMGFFSLAEGEEK